MDVSTPTVSPLRQRMVEDMRMRKFEPKTQAGCLRAVRKLTKFLGRSPDTATAEDAWKFRSCAASLRPSRCPAPTAYGWSAWPPPASKWP